MGDRICEVSLPLFQYGAPAECFFDSPEDQPGTEQCQDASPKVDIRHGIKCLLLTSCHIMKTNLF